MSTQAHLQAIVEAIASMDEDCARLATERALRAGHHANIVLSDAVMVGMDEVGARYQRGEYFVSDLLCSSDAMSAALDVLRPHLEATRSHHFGTVVIGVVEGDVHDIGKNLVATLLGIAGFEVYDLGRSVSIRRFADAVLETGATAVGLSSLMTTTRDSMGAVIADIRERCGDCPVVVGGASVSEAFAREIGADAYAPDAIAGIEVFGAFALQRLRPVIPKGAV